MEINFRFISYVLACHAAEKWQSTTDIRNNSSSDREAKVV